jgi:hypothetical protein
MTEVEAVTLTQILIANASSGYAVFLTLVSGYLLVAHLAGKTLTRSQLTIITILYAMAVGYTIFVWFGITLTSIHYQGVAAELRGTLNFSDERGVIFGLVLMVAIALAPLKYMWDVRH